jgi:hypothetical protein
VTDEPQRAVLKLKVSPLVRYGERIEASIDAINLSETVVMLSAPDTVVISQPHTEVVGTGTFQRNILWTVEHAQEGTSSWVEITVSAGHVTQMGQCKVVG